MSRADHMDLLRGAALALFIVLASTAFAADIDCAAIRAHVAEHGKAKAVAWARGQGYSWSEIWRIRKQCGI